VRVVVLATCLALPTAHPVAQPIVRPTRVLLLYSLAPDSPTAAPFIDRLRTTVRSELPPPVQVFAEFLDLDRFPDPKQAPRLARYLGDKYGKFGIDIVIATGSVALQFATGPFREHLPNVPVVFGMALAQSVDVSALPPNVTGRLITTSLGRTLTMARRLQPDLERVYVVAGTSSLDSINLADALGSLGAMRDSVRVVVRQGRSLESLRAELRRLPPHSVMFFAHYRRDDRGQVVVPLEALATLARESRAPTYHFMDPTIGTGVVGGAMVRHDDEAMRLGLLAARVLRAPVGAPLPPVELAASRFVADWRTLQRFKLDERRLPPGTEVRFRVPSTWARYRHVILTALGIMTAQALLIGALLVERRARRRAQQALRDQSAYERTMAELATDAVRHAPEDAPRALEDALARVGSYARADAAVLVQHEDGTSRPESRLYWMGRPGLDMDALMRTMFSGSEDGYRLELPLVVAGESLGTLALVRIQSDERWRGSPRVSSRPRKSSPVRSLDRGPRQRSTRPSVRSRTWDASPSSANWARRSPTSYASR
jgi:hypothetical protein